MAGGLTPVSALPCCVWQALRLHLLCNVCMHVCMCTITPIHYIYDRCYVSTYIHTQTHTQMIAAIVDAPFSLATTFSCTSPKNCTQNVWWEICILNALYVPKLYVKYAGHKKNALYVPKLQVRAQEELFACTKTVDAGSRRMLCMYQNCKCNMRSQEDGLGT